MLPGNAFDFHECVHGESGNLDSGTGGLVIAERLLVYLVDDGKVVHGVEEHLRKSLDDWRGKRTGHLTVVFITFPISLPEASTTARRFLNTCFACSSTLPATNFPVTGSSATFPDTNKRSPNFTA